MAKGALLESLFTSVREQARARKAADPADKVAVLLSAMLPHQRILELDRSRHVSVISPRQTGKSTGIMLLVSIRCLQSPGAEWVVIALTRPSAKRIYWGPLKKLNKELELGITFQEQELVARFPNGSLIYFVGGDTISEVEKLRGGRYNGAVIDECKSYPASVFQILIDEILQPALNTKRGPMILIGTPGDILAGEFYLATIQPAVKFQTPLGERTSNRLYSTTGAGKWSLHVWSLKNNTAVPHLWADALELKDRNGWADDHPVWLREYIGQWVATDHFMVYRYASHRHDYVPSENGRFGLDPDAIWHTVIGWDLGSVDGTAAVIWAFSPTAPGLWEVYSEKRVRSTDVPLNIATLAQWYRELDVAYGPFEASVADTASLATMVVDSLASEHGVYLEPAEKKEKPDHIELFNTDLDRALIHLLADSELAQEMAENRWDEKKLEQGKRVEKRATPNDLCDAGLYAWRWCYHRRAKPATPETSVGSPQWWAAVAAQELASARERARQKADPNYMQLDREWWHEHN